MVKAVGEGVLTSCLSLLRHRCQNAQVVDLCELQVIDHRVCVAQEGWFMLSLWETIVDYLRVNGATVLLVLKREYLMKIEAGVSLQALIYVEQVFVNLIFFYSSDVALHEGWAFTRRLEVLI